MAETDCMELFTIEEWGPTSPRWPEFVAYVTAEALAFGAIDERGLVPEAHFLAALWGGDKLVGILMFLVQPIGPEMDVPVLRNGAGEPLLEAKIRVFHVLDAYRNKGVGTALQRHVLRRAAALGCYQVRSRSEFSRSANYAVKLKLGFVAHPAIREVRGVASPGVYWIKHVGPLADDGATDE
jgi:GNAT superfamily N-acetyltransferase